MFFSYKEHLSPKNGVIHVTRFLWSTPSVSVQGCLQSGSYIASMWKNVFSKLPNTFSPKKIAVLGLGGGNAISLLQKKYQHASIVIIEWDEVMIQIARDLQVFALSDNIQIIHGDVFTVLPELKEKFDIIVVDLFTGDVPPVELTSTEVLKQLKRLLTEDGYMFVNFFRHIEYRNYFKEFFSEEVSVAYKQNNLTRYRSRVYL